MSLRYTWDALESHNIISKQPLLLLFFYVIYIWYIDEHSENIRKVTILFLWSRELEDRAKVVRVENLNNPYKNQSNFDSRFKLTLNKLYAWTLVDYERVIMLDADNLFLEKTDELFQCGQFCAVFINPCIFHTGLFVLQVYYITHSFCFLICRCFCFWYIATASK